MPRPVFDALVHEPTRLRLCALLVPAPGRDFSSLREELAVTESALSKHVRTLKAKGYVETARRRENGVDRTEVALTPLGRRAFCGHVAEIQRLATLARRFEHLEKG